MKIIEFGTNRQRQETSLADVLQRKDKGLYTTLQLPPGYILLRQDNQEKHTIRERVNISPTDPLKTSKKVKG